jgi:hypothetical protein
MFREEMTSKFELPVSATGTFVGATVSNAIYHAIATSGDMAAHATESSIEFTGNMLGLGTDLVIGPLAGNAVRALARTYGAVAKPAISTSVKLGAAGVSVVAGTGVALTTTALVYGGRKLGSYIYTHYVNYKRDIAANIQYPMPNFSPTKDIICIDDPHDLSLLEKDEDD